MSKTRNRARQWFLLTKSPESEECYRQWNQHFCETIKTLKRNAWLRFLENLSNHSLWKMLSVTKQSTTKSILPLRCPNGTLTLDKPVQAELLFKGTSCIAVPIDLADVPDRPNSHLMCYPQVTTEEITECIEKIAPKKAPGVDGIANELLKISSPSLSPLLVPINPSPPVPSPPHGNAPSRPSSLKQGRTITLTLTPTVP
ncbi:hypothetical protein PCASD_22372 [Puccinia coronata f. sp. avenae]|uniref:Uncharacterized protein n=1 Tax=Puccinia coronata f. sp. avenae TaxID=200324 RepID=A0A2N5SR93_9BASI|nr:hypothetical protein PCASD_22372 [Puccinia coronata f. sp. avenae]